MATDRDLDQPNQQLASWDAYRVTVRLRSVGDGLTRVLEPYSTWSDNGWTFTVDRRCQYQMFAFCRRHR